MTAQDLYDRVTIEWRGHGAYLVTIKYRGKKYTTVSNNSLAYYRIKTDDTSDNQRGYGGYTLKGAYNYFYDLCKRRNDLC